MFSRIGSAAFKKDLVNIKKLCDHLGNPQSRFKSIHIGGTNGKGSVSHMLAAIFQQAGYKTGLYTSPHLYDFRERIRISGEMIEKDFVSSFIEKIKPLINEIEPSFFEITVAMAFEYFASQLIDIAIVEVGLGGRLDSTNIIYPELSIITNIGWDHMNMLGNTLELIAAEKAGIIKENIPVVIGERSKESDPVFKSVADSKAASLYFAEDRFAVSNYQLEENNLCVCIHDKAKRNDKWYTLDLPGIYQTKNLVTVLQCIELLKDWNIEDDDVLSALSSVKSITGFQGRWDIIHKDPLVVLDVAHNRNGIEQMMRHVNQIRKQKLHIILGTVKDKELNRILPLFPKQAIYYFTQADIPRALEADQLQSEAEKYHLQGETYSNVNAAFQAALLKANAEDMILICGSIFLVAEVNRKLITQLT
jgi:folylpolyglutamate synthase/dihydrofolate synthase